MLIFEDGIDPSEIGFRLHARVDGPSKISYFIQDIEANDADAIEISRDDFIAMSHFKIGAEISLARRKLETLSDGLIDAVRPEE